MRRIQVLRYLVCTSIALSAACCPLLAVVEQALEQMDPSLYVYPESTRVRRGGVLFEVEERYDNGMSP